MDSGSNKLWLVLLTVNLILLNIGLAFVWFNRAQTTLPRNGGAPTVTLAPTSSEPTPATSPTSTLVPTATKKPATKSTTKKTSYLPIPGNGASLLSYTWADLPGTEFYLNPSDFPGLTEVRFEANIRLFNGNGQAFLRLFDVGKGVEVWGSEISTTSQTSTVVLSQPLQLRPNGNAAYLLRVQAKSLTADTTVFDSGRLKITTYK